MKPDKIEATSSFVIHFILLMVIMFCFYCCSLIPKEQQDMLFWLYLLKNAK